MAEDDFNDEEGARNNNTNAAATNDEVVQVAQVAQVATLDNAEEEQEAAPEPNNNNDNNKGRDNGDDQVKWKDFFCVCFTIVLLIAGVAAVAVFFRRNRASDLAAAEEAASNALEQEMNKNTLPPTPAPPPPVLIEDPQEQLDYVLQAISQNSILAETYLDMIPSNADELTDILADDEDVAAEVRAASWLIHDDPTNDRDELVNRFVLASLYYSTRGQNWTRSDHWLTDEPVCHDVNDVDPSSGRTTTSGWYGITCCKGTYRTFSVICKPPHQRPNDVVDIVLDQNNLDGPIPEVLALLPAARNFDFSWNALQGHIPGDALATMPNIVFLKFQHNNLTGPIPPVLSNATLLETLYLQGNSLSGSWPNELCKPCEDCEKRLTYFGVDCDENYCDGLCCTVTRNCFYGNNNGTNLTGYYLDPPT